MASVAKMSTNRHVTTPPSSRTVALSVRSKTPSSSSASRRSVTPNSRSYTRLHHDDDHYDHAESGRVRVAIRVRPKNTEEILSDADFFDCVEPQPELKKLKLKKNNWSSESYRFDEVFTESASQKRVYEAVAKPVVEGVLNGYNGTIMAYGQTGTGKTYTLGKLGKDDASERGIMVRALEDIISGASSLSDSIEISYLQIYMEAVQDLLAPEKVNIPIVEDPKNGEVSVPCAAVVNIQNVDQFLQVLQIGEANRHAANIKMNTESSRSHAILMVSLRRSINDKEENSTSFQGKDDRSVLVGGHVIPTIRKSKLLIVDLAGSEHLDKSGSARTSLIVTIGPSSRHHTETASTIMFGQRAMKVINFVKLKEEFDYESLCRQLENQIDILTKEVDRQQKSNADDTLRLENNLRECQNSFEQAKASLTARCELLERDKSQLESKLKDIIKELKSQKDHNDLVCKEVERLERSSKYCESLEKEKSKLESEMKDVLEELEFQKNQNNLMHDEIACLELGLEHNKQYEAETSTYKKVLADTTQMYEKKIAELMSQLEEEREHSNSVEKQLNSMKNLLREHQKSMEQYQIERATYQKALSETTKMYEQKNNDLVVQLEDEHAKCVGLEEQMILLTRASTDHQSSLQIEEKMEIDNLKMKLQEMTQLHETTLDELQLVKTEHNKLSSEKARLGDELQAVRDALSLEEKRRKAVEKELSSIKNAVPESEDDFEDKRPSMKENIARGSNTGAPLGLHNSNKSREMNSFQRTTIAKICEEVGLQKILALLQSSDLDVQTHAVKVVANLAAEDTNQEKIVQEGGLDALLILLRTSQNTTLLRVASGAIANLAMNEPNQGLIMGKGGAALLAHTASKTDDPQTLRMVAGAIANLCGNEKLHVLLIEQGGIRALLGMVRSGNNDVIAQVARGIANFAKCESRAITQGHKKGRSLLMDGILTWLLANSNTASISTRRHIELALCHLAQNEDNTKDFMTSGGVTQLLKISVESSREDIRDLAKKILRLNRSFKAVMQQ